jgi:hypothetical protein
VGVLCNSIKSTILIIDKQLATCIRNTTVHEEGHIIHTRMEVSSRKFVNFVSVYGYPHSPDNRGHHLPVDHDENLVLQGMERIQKSLKHIISKARKYEELIYIYGDLQDTPDRSKTFYYGNTTIAKHPTGIVQLCEDQNLQCTIYKFVDLMPKPIISRHGPKGGRFIDDMFTDYHGISIILAYFLTIVLLLPKLTLVLKNSRYVMTRRRELIFDVS